MDILGKTVPLYAPIREVHQGVDVKHHTPINAPDALVTTAVGRAQR